jgi:geranylgeranyl diphosphate synthase type II
MQYFKHLQERFIKRLAEEAQAIGANEPDNLYQPIRYTLDMGGKRLRPVMVLAVCELFGGQADEAMSAAIGIEVFHNFTLLHDDIMDHATLRRNRQTVHEKYSINVAILSGDAMSNMSYLYLLKTRSSYLSHILTLFSKTAMEVCEGQQYDMDFETRTDVSISEYIEMIRLKTAVLIACSLKTGAIIGGASPADADLLYTAGINLGIAFQIQDDLLDVYADQSKFGKQIGGDIVANKKTFLLLKALELADSYQKAALLKQMTTSTATRDEKINAVRHIYDALNIQNITASLIDSYYCQANSDIEKLSIDSNQKTNLHNFVRQIMHREK